MKHCLIGQAENAHLTNAGSFHSLLQARVKLPVWPSPALRPTCCSALWILAGPAFQPLLCLLPCQACLCQVGFADPDGSDGPDTGCSEWQCNKSTSPCLRHNKSTDPCLKHNESINHRLYMGCTQAITCKEIGSTYQAQLASPLTEPF